jgi:predicted phage tail protein
MNTLTTIILADEEFVGKVGNTDFWATPLGNVLQTLMGIVGILVVIYAVLKAVKNIATGKVADGVKAIAGAVLLAAVLFNPPLIQKAIAAGGNLVESAIETVSSIGDGSSNTGGSSDTPQG